MPRHARTPAPAAAPAGGRRAAGAARRRRRARRLRGSLLLCCTLVAVGAGGVLGGMLPVPPGVPKSLVLSGDSTTQAAAGPSRHPGHGALASAGPGGTAPAVAGTARTTGGSAGSASGSAPTASVSTSASTTSTAASASPSLRPSSAAASRTASATATASARPSLSTDPVAAAREEVLRLVNVQRTKAGCGTLKEDEALDGLAQSFSHEMAVRNFFSHTDPDGRSPWDRAKALGITNLGGENIARGQQTPESVMTAWMNSPGHRANILNCDYHSLGVGAYFASGGPWWTQDFGF